jgi:hypothetical protein
LNNFKFIFGFLFLFWLYFCTTYFVTHSFHFHTQLAIIAAPSPSILMLRVILRRWPALAASAHPTRALSAVSNQQNSSSSSSSTTTTLYGVVASLIAGAAVTSASHLTDEISECTGDAAPFLSDDSDSNSSDDAAEAATAATKIVMGKLRSQFACPVLVLNNLADRMTEEMNKGLVSTKGAQIKMLPSFVNHLPTGKESGEFLALDLGGSNFRVCTFRFEAGMGVQLIDAQKVTIPASLMTSKSSAKDLFGFIADQVGKAPGACDTSTPDLNLGFTFSFPVDQKSINSGILLHWTKGFATRDCVGEEIVSLLQKELSVRSISVNVSALVNDTVGTLVANILDDSDTHVGVILGTGCNACYIEKACNIIKMESTSGLLDEEMVRIMKIFVFVFFIKGIDVFVWIPIPHFVCCLFFSLPLLNHPILLFFLLLLLLLFLLLLLLLLFFFSFSFFFFLRLSTWNGVVLIHILLLVQLQSMIMLLIVKKIQHHNVLKNKFQDVI